MRRNPSYVRTSKEQLVQQNACNLQEDGSADLRAMHASCRAHSFTTILRHERLSCPTASTSRVCGWYHAIEQHTVRSVKRRGAALRMRHALAMGTHLRLLTPLTCATTEPTRGRICTLGKQACCLSSAYHVSESCSPCQPSLTPSHQPLLQSHPAQTARHHAVCGTSSSSASVVSAVGAPCSRTRLSCT